MTKQLTGKIYFKRLLFFMTLYVQERHIDGPLDYCTWRKANEGDISELEIHSMISELDTRQ